MAVVINDLKRDSSGRIDAVHSFERKWEPADTAVKNIESGWISYDTYVNGERTTVRVRRTTSGEKILSTAKDAETGHGLDHM
ncbi:DUF3892 domain-containing protein [Arcanobacterium haemolyticum]|nr:DUF3892 domain-containing protein [Arcanobacterium haemolyticum]